MGTFKVHHVRFFEYKPATINSLAYNKTKQRLALSRSDGSVEIYAKNNGWYQEKVIAVSEERSVEGLTWLDDRLFSVGLDTNVVEYDLVSLQIKRQESSCAGAIWCITKNDQDQQLAVGTEDGCVVLLDAEDDKLEYMRAFDKLEGRILCIAWHTGESVIVTGGPDNIRIWSVKSGQALQRIALGGKDTIVWCLAITSNMTIISGDSRGKTSFWNGKQGTRITHFQSHKADVLTLCVDESETSVYCSGVDPAVVQYSYLTPSDNSGWRSWVRSSVLTSHTHDVRASVMADNTLVTGGVDTNLICSQVSGQRRGRFLRVPAVPALSMVSVAKKARLLLLRYPTYLEVWRLGHTDSSSDVNGHILPLQQQQLKLLQLKARPGKRITCSTISQDGTIVAFSDGEKVRLHRLSVTDVESLSPTVQVSRVALPARDNRQPAQQVAVTPDNRLLLVATSVASLQVWDISGEDISLLHTILPHGSGRVAQHSFSNLCVSDSGKLAVTSDTGGHVHVYNLSEGEMVCSLPVLAQQATAISFTPGGSSVLVTYSDNSVREFDIKKAEYTAWSRDSQWPDQWVHQRGLLRGIMSQPSQPSTLFLHSEHNLLVVNRAQPAPSKDYKLFRGASGSNTDTPRPLIACSKYKFILHMEFLTPDSLVLVERTPMAIQDELPAALRQKKFGT